MNTARLSALAQQEETVLEKSVRELFYKEGECRFTMEVLTADKTIRHYNLHAISKPKAMNEATELVTLMKQQFELDRIIWRIPGVTNWSFVSAQAEVQQKPIKKVTLRERMSQFVEKYFYIEDEI